IDDTIAISSGSIEDWLANISDNLVQVEDQLEFALRGTDSDERLTFTPQYLRYQDRYGIYFRLEGEQGQAPEAEEPSAETWTDCDAPSNPSGGASSGGAASSSSGGAGPGNTGGSTQSGGAGGSATGGASSGANAGGTSNSGGSGDDLTTGNGESNPGCG